VNLADYDELLRVPGIGVLSARRIVTSRRVTRLTFDNLKKLGVVLKRAVYLITCSGAYMHGLTLNERLIFDNLTLGSRRETTRVSGVGAATQLSYLENNDDTVLSIAGSSPLAALPSEL
jgi:predicted DNA-binding helix-hairpin-helix protein